MKRLALSILLLALALPGFAADKKDIRYITLSGTRLLEKPTAFSKTLRKLATGTSVWVVKSQGAYLFVSTGSDKPGWIPARSVQTSRPKIGSSSRASSDASSEEVAAATKGFNSQVEANYSKDNPALDFKQLDRLEARTLFTDPVAGLEGFRKTGKLGEFSGGSND